MLMGVYVASSEYGVQYTLCGFLHAYLTVRVFRGPQFTNKHSTELHAFFVCLYKPYL